MLRNVVRIGVSFLLIMVITAGTCLAAGTPDSKTAQEQLAEKLVELGKRYGYMSVGTARFSAENDRAEVLFPEEAAQHDQGILFSDLYDYDGDGSPELLLFRRQKGYVNYEHEEGFMSCLERSEYLFEMYEYYESGGCGVSGRFVVGAVDAYTIFSDHTSMTVFRKDQDGRTELFMETTMSGQDHPEDICLVKLRYESGRFCDYSAIRYGAINFGENSVRYMESKSIEAFEALSYSGSANDRLWDIKASADDYDEAFTKTLETGLADFGLTLRTTRREAQLEHNKMYSGNEGLEEEEALWEYSALDCYGTGSGELTPLAFTFLHRDLLTNRKSSYSLKLNRTIYTEDPDGTERPVLDM
ncbi:MAG: hypothetical protein Q4D81_02985 [Eubacteriales bacterium]|nr:hypothetical protein [Eubacteriales bacterium]